MKSWSHFQSPERFRSRALGILLLAIPLSGIALQCSPAQAQPVSTQPGKKNPAPLSPEQKAIIDKVFAISRQEKVCKTLVDIKVENATVDDVIDHLKQMLPTGTLSVETRDVGLLRVSFDLKNIPVGDVLTSVSALAGCKMFVRPDGLLISPSGKLTTLELGDVQQRLGGEWSQSFEAGGSGWSTVSNASALFTRAIAQEATGSAAEHLPQTVVKTTFGNFSPDSQNLLTEMASWLNQGPSRKSRIIHLDATTPISVDTTNPNAITVVFAPDTSEPGVPSIGIRNATASATIKP